jgi:hypothetical protein
MIFSTRKAISFKAHVKGCPGLFLINSEALWARRISPKHGTMASGG